MPNAHYGKGDGTGEPSPTPLAIPSARPPHALAGSLTTRHTPEPLGLTASRSTTDRVQPLAGASPLALSGAGAQQPARGAVAGVSRSTGEIDELIAELARRRSPRRTTHELGSLSTEAIDEAIEAHPRRRPRLRSPPPQQMHDDALPVTSLTGSSHTTRSTRCAPIDPTCYAGLSSTRPRRATRVSHTVPQGLTKGVSNGSGASRKRRTTPGCGLGRCPRRPTCSAKCGSQSWLSSGSHR